MGRKQFKNDRPRSIGAGFAFCFSLGLLIFFSLGSSAFSGCAGDCITCHPGLKDDPDHRSLKTCVSCHDPAKPKTGLFLSSAAGCGDRCFLCHREWPRDGAHADLYTCLDCHNR